MPGAHTWGRHGRGLGSQDCREATSLQRMVHWLNGPPGGGRDGGQTQRPLTPFPYLLEQRPSPHCTLGFCGSLKQAGAQAPPPTRVHVSPLRSPSCKNQEPEEEGGHGRWSRVQTPAPPLASCVTSVSSNMRRVPPRRSVGILEL